MVQCYPPLPRVRCCFVKQYSSAPQLQAGADPEETAKIVLGYGLRESVSHYDIFVALKLAKTLISLFTFPATTGQSIQHKPGRRFYILTATGEFLLSYSCLRRYSILKAFPPATFIRRTSTFPLFSIYTTFNSASLSQPNKLHDAVDHILTSVCTRSPLLYPH